MRALDDSCRWPDGVPLLAFIAGIMRSPVDGRVHERRRLAERAGGLAIDRPELAAEGL
ncbi:MAG TPA: hypothetical protein VGF39_14490 [Stellaceae bacterium]